MSIRALQEDTQVIELLEDMSRMAKSAKKIEELADAMDNIASQTTLLALDASVINQRSHGLKQISNTVTDASHEMLSQFDLLRAEVVELEKFIKRFKTPNLKGKDLN